MMVNRESNESDVSSVESDPSLDSKKSSKVKKVGRDSTVRKEINQLLEWDGAPKQEIIREKSHDSNSNMDEKDSDYGSEKMDVVRTNEIDNV